MVKRKVKIKLNGRFSKINMKMMMRKTTWNIIVLFIAMHIPNSDLEKKKSSVYFVRTGFIQNIKNINLIIVEQLISKLLFLYQK